MKVGDLVKFETSERCDHRRVGIVLRFSLYGKSTSIIEVLWNTAQMVWITVDQVEVISENQ